MVRFRSSSRYIPATVLCRDFSLTLTTLALYQRSLRWFEACSCKPAPRGLPSSLAQLRAHYKTMRSWRTYLHILLSPAIFNNTNGILDFADPFIQKYPMIKLPCLSNELTHSGSCFRGRPEIIHSGRITAQVCRACWILWFEPS